jgi:hypothetical protein
MQFRPYGDTGRVLSCMGVEISSNIKKQPQYNSILNRAFKRGINYIQYDYRVFRRFLNLRQGLEKANPGTPIEIALEVPANIIKIKSILKMATKQLGVSTIDFLVINSKNPESIILTNIINNIKKDNRVRHVIVTVNNKKQDIQKIENRDKIDGLYFTDNSVLMAIGDTYTYRGNKGASVHNIYSGDKYKADNCILFIAKALANPDINLVTHRFLNAKEVDFIIDFVEKEESLNHDELTDEKIIEHVKELEYYEVLKEQKSLFKKIKSIFRKKHRIING